MRTVHGRFLLRPSRTVNDLVTGVIGRAQHKYGSEGARPGPGHGHALLTPESSQQLAAFMDYVAGKLLLLLPAQGTVGGPRASACPPIPDA